MTSNGPARAGCARAALLAWALLWALGCGAGGGGDDRPEEPHGDAAHAEDEHGAHDDHGDEHDEGEEHDEHDEGVVELDPAAVERLGLTTMPATRRPLAGERTATGRVGYDETRLAHVAPRVSGRLVTVAAELGDRVQPGERLAVLDSRELGEARAEYLRARAREEVARRRHERQSSLHAARIVSEQEVLEAEAEARAEAAEMAAHREHLRLLGLADADIDRLSWDDASRSQVAVRAPFAGWVVTRAATLGQLVTPEDVLFTLADLSEVWLWVDLYERDLRHVALGDRAAVQLDAWPGETFAGEVAYVADEIDPATRTVRARIDLPNPARRLKPGMFARVTLAALGEGEEAEVLVIPREAIQRRGDEAIVFVRSGATRFERREVELGRLTAEWAEVLDGIEPGDEVVTNGSFLLKSQASADELGGHHH